MRPRSKIRVLVVEDSLVFREVLSRGLSLDPSLQVVATASDPFEARDKIIEHEPDVMTCDVEMPKMNGIEFIRRLLPQYPLPVVVVSGMTDAVFDAMNAGAIDFVGKPNLRSADSVKSFLEEITAKVKIAARAKVLEGLAQPGLEKIRTLAPKDEKVIAIGASTGGVEAIFQILKALPESAPGIVIAQHIPAGFSRMFAERLAATTALRAKEGQTNDRVERGVAFVAPGDQHMRLKKTATGYIVQCSREEKVNGHRPSVDLLFESVAKEAGRNAIGIILTGMGYDGAKGLLAMRRKGSRTIGQDERSSVVYGMPKVAYEIGAVEKQLPLEQVPQTIYGMLAERPDHD